MTPRDIELEHQKPPLPFRVGTPPTSPTSRGGASPPALRLLSSCITLCDFQAASALVTLLLESTIDIVSLCRVISATASPLPPLLSTPVVVLSTGTQTTLRAHILRDESASVCIRAAIVVVRRTIGYDSYHVGVASAEASVVGFAVADAGRNGGIDAFPAL